MRLHKHNARSKDWLICSIIRIVPYALVEADGKSEWQYVIIYVTYRQSLGISALR